MATQMHSLNPDSIRNEKFTAKFLLFVLLDRINQRIGVMFSGEPPDQAGTIMNVYAEMCMLDNYVYLLSGVETCDEVKKAKLDLEQNKYLLSRDRLAKWEFWEKLNTYFIAITRNLHKTGLIDARDVAYIAGSGMVDKILSGEKMQNSFPEYNVK